jgi:fructose-specific phosphotransferase system IIA component
MLIIVMHNNQAYLESLIQLVKKEDITDATIIHREGVGIRLLGEEVEFIFHKGELSPAYNKALLIVVKGEEKAKSILDLIEKDTSLRWLNLEDRGFICTVPFQQIKYLELESSSIKKEEISMKVTEFLREDRMVLDIKANTKDGAIKELAEILRDAPEIINFENFVRDIFERESLNTTGIGNEIAIPHARTDSVNNFIIAFGRSIKGIDFKSLDGKSVKLIFLMGTPKEKGLNNYLKILAHLTRLLQKEHFKDSLLKASSPREVIEEFQKIEK